MRWLVNFAVACVLGFYAGGAAATTYTANRGVGAGAINLSITTDGTLGILSTANITDWTILLSAGDDAFTLEGPSGSNNSSSLVSTSRLYATASDLLYDLDFEGTFPFLDGFVIQSPTIGSGGPFWCVGIGGCTGAAIEAIQPGGVRSFQMSAHSGQFVIGSVGGGVPEPATWALMIGGLGLAGVALRRRLATTAVA